MELSNSVVYLVVVHVCFSSFHSAEVNAGRHEYLLFYAMVVPGLLTVMKTVMFGIFYEYTSSEFTTNRMVFCDCNSVIYFASSVYVTMFLFMSVNVGDL